MIFGGQTVTFVSYAETGSRGALGTYAQAETATDVVGCRHRPMAFQETSEYDVDVATELWRTTAPPEPAVLAAPADGVLRVDGVTYRIIGGPRCHADLDGTPFKVTIVSQRTTG